VSRHCGDSPIRLALMSSNRFSQRWAGLVASMNQLIPITLDAGEDCLRRPALEALQNKALRAYRVAMHDVDAMWPANLGLPPETDRTPTCMYNVVTPWVSDQSSPIQDGDVPSISWEPVFTSLGPRCYLRACETTTDTLILTLRTTGVEEAVNIEMLREIYSTIIEAGERATALSGSSAGAIAGS
jgi:hypothetical protein